MAKMLCMMRMSIVVESHHSYLCVVNCAVEATLDRPTDSMTAKDAVNLGNGVAGRGWVNHPLAHIRGAGMSV